MTKKRKFETANGDSARQRTRQIHGSEAPDTATLTSKLTEIHSLLSTALENPEAAVGSLASIEATAREARSLAIPSSPVPPSSFAGHYLHDNSNSLSVHSTKLPTAPAIKDKRLEKALFTHQGSLRAHENVSDNQSYERYEFLGDAYIEVIATRLLWHLYPTLPTGRLAFLREQLVNNKTLGEFSSAYGFDKRLDVTAEVAASEKAAVKMKGDVFEAYIAAVILDDPLHGFKKVERWLQQLWLPKLDQLNVPTGLPNLMAKEDLSRKIGGANIKVRYVDERPPIMHKEKGIETFFVGVYLDGWGYVDQHLGSGQGLNKRAAGNEAATMALRNRPLIDDIITKKAIYDDTVKKQREQATEKRNTVSC